MMEFYEQEAIFMTDVFLAMDMDLFYSGST